MRAVPTTLHRGDTLYFLAQVYTNPQTGEVQAGPQNAPPPGWVPLSLVGAGVRVWFTLKNFLPDPDLAAVMMLDNLALGGIVVTTAASGQFVVTGPAGATLTFPDGPVDLQYDLQVKDALARIFTLEQGSCRVVPDVTRAVT